MSTVTREFKIRLLEGGAPNLLDGVLSIRVVRIDKFSSSSGDVRTRVLLDIGVIDPITDELLVEQETILVSQGDVLKLANLKKAFKIKLA